MFRQIKYRTVGEDLTKPMDLGLRRVFDLFFLGCARTTAPEKFPEACWTWINYVGQKESQQVTLSRLSACPGTLLSYQPLNSRHTQVHIKYSLPSFRDLQSSEKM